MLKKLTNRQKGFTLIELLIVVAIIGIIAALLIPNFLDALQKAKQKRTVADERAAGTAFMSLMTDMASAAAAGQSKYKLSTPLEADKLALAQQILETRYIQKVPVLDGWKNPYDYWIAASIDSEKTFAIRSGGLCPGTDCFETDDYVVTNFTPTDYEQDIVWADGFFVRWPLNTTNKKFDQVNAN